MVDEKRGGDSALSPIAPWYAESGSGSSQVVFFFILTLAVHLFDGLINGFSRAPGNLLLIITMYVIVTLVALFLIYKTGWSSETLKIIAVSLLTFLLPYVVVWYSPDWIVALLLALPVWPVYLFFYSQGSNAVDKIGKWYLFIIIILAVYMLFSSVTIGPMAYSSGVDTHRGVLLIKHYFWDNTKALFKAVFITGPARIQTAVDQSLGMDYFMGRVEDNKDAPLGVYLEDIRATEPVFYEHNPIVMWASLHGKSFQGALEITTRCYAQDGDEFITGEVTPDTVTLYYDQTAPLECVFDKTLKEGYYTVVFASSFNFPTWGYITYIFVDRETSKAYYTQRKDINQELGIPREAAAIYTSGPAGIGMNEVSLPLVIDANNPYLPPFGVTLSNLWSHGKIVSVKSLEVRVPEGLRLTNCIPKESGKKTESDGTDIYTFKISSPREFFTTITCKMELDDPKDFLGTNLKVTKTLAVSAEYIYTLEQSKSIIVEKIGP